MHGGMARLTLIFLSLQFRQPALDFRLRSGFCIMGVAVTAMLGPLLPVILLALLLGEE